MSPRNPATAARSRPEDEAAASWDELPVHILERLASENIRSAEDWLALSRPRRAAIFGVTPAMRRVIDAAAKATCEGSAG
jgi:hypothetical protein